MEKEITLLKLLQKSKCLEIHFKSGEAFELPCAYLREHSPAAEERIGEDCVLDPNVNINQIDPVGNYAVKLVFSDGHNTSIYSFDYLYQLGQRYMT